jgi:hypothetical protein
MNAIWTRSYEITLNAVLSQMEATSIQLNWEILKHGNFLALCARLSANMMWYLDRMWYLGSQFMGRMWDYKLNLAVRSQLPVHAHLLRVQLIYLRLPNAHVILTLQLIIAKGQETHTKLWSKLGLISGPVSLGLCYAMWENQKYERTNRTQSRHRLANFPEHWQIQNALSKESLWTNPHVPEFHSMLYQ